METPLTPVPGVAAPCRGTKRSAYGIFVYLTKAGLTITDIVTGAAPPPPACVQATIAARATAKTAKAKATPKATAPKVKAAVKRLNKSVAVKAGIGPVNATLATDEELAAELAALTDEERATLPPTFDNGYEVPAGYQPANATPGGPALPDSVITDALTSGPTKVDTPRRAKKAVKDTATQPVKRQKAVAA